MTMSAGAHRAFADAGGRHQDPLMIQPHRKISVHRRHEATLMQHASVANNLFPVFAFSGHGKLSWGSDESG